MTTNISRNFPVYVRPFNKITFNRKRMKLYTFHAIWGLILTRENGIKKPSVAVNNFKMLFKQCGTHGRVHCKILTTLKSLRLQI